MPTCYTTKRLPDIQPLPIMDSDDAHEAAISGLRADNDILRLALDRSEAERRRLRAALSEISEDKNAYNSDPWQNARTVMAMMGVARAALGGDK